MTDLYRERPVTARKRHLCMACRRAIQARESYLRCEGGGPDGFWSYPYHADCRQQETRENWGRGEYGDGDQWSFLHEIVAEDRGILWTFPLPVFTRFAESRP